MLKYLIASVVALGLAGGVCAAQPNSGAPPAPSVCGNVTLTAGPGSLNVALPIGPGNCTATTVLNDGTVEAFVQIGNVSVTASIPTPGSVTQVIAVPPGQSVPMTSGGSRGGYLAAITSSGSTTLRITQANGSVPYTGGAGSGGTGGTVTAVQPVGSLLHMTCDSGCSSSTAPADESPFTPGTTSQTPIGGYYPATPTTAPLTAGQMGAAQLTQFRALHVDLHNAAGTEVGTPTTPIQVSLANTGFNPVAVATIANAGANLNTSLLALESGGNLANISSGVVGGVVQENIKQVGAATVAVGAGVATAGSQRVVAAQDTTTIAGSAPGTAGTASPNAITVQGIASMTPLTVAQTTGSNLHIVCDSGCSSSTAPADEAAFTAGTTSQTPVGGFFQTTATSNPLTNGQMGAMQLTANRALFVNPRNASGVETGTASTPLQVSLANTAANGTSVSVAITGTLPAFAATPTVNLGTLNGAATAANQEVTVAGTTATSAQGVQGVTGGVPMPVSGTVTAVQATGSNLHIVCDTGCSSSTAPADEATFTFGTTSQTPIGGAYQTTATSNPLTSGQMGVVQLTQFRAEMVNLRTAAGAEIGTAASPIQVSVANTAANATPMVVTANAGTNLNTSALALESGGNLATLAGTVTSAVLAANLKQVNGVTTLTGAGASGTGAQRVTVSQDTTTIAGAAPGTAGTASANVVSVQGIASMTPLTVAQPTGSNLHIVCDSGCNASAAPADESTFTAGTTSQTPIGGFYQTTTTAAPLTSGQMGAVQLTQFRAEMVNLRTAAGAEIGTAASPVQVSLANTAANGTSVSVALTGTLPAFAATPTVNLGTLGGAATAANQEVTAAGTTATSAQGVQGVTGGVAMNVAQATGSNLHIVCDSGCSSSTAPADESSFTFGTTSQTPIGGVYQTTATSSPLTNGQMGAVQLTQFRAQMVNLRTAAGGEIGTSASPAIVAGAISNASSGVATSSTNTGSAAYGYAFNGTTWDQVQDDASKNLKVNVAAAIAAGTNTIGKVDLLGNGGAAMDFAGQNAASPANSLMMGGQFNTSPTTITSGNASPLQLDNAGNLKVNVASGGTLAQGATLSGAQGSMIMGASGSGINAIIQADTSAAISISTATTTQLVALSSGKKIYVTGWDVIAAGTGNIELEYGTGTNCGTGTTALTGNYNLTAQVGISKGGNLGPVLIVPSGNALCALTSAAVGMAGSLTYTQF